MMDMQTSIADWKANAERHSDHSFRFFRSLEMKYERVVDRAAREFHDEASLANSLGRPWSRI